MFELNEVVDRGSRIWISPPGRKRGSECYPVDRNDGHLCNKFETAETDRMDGRHPVYFVP